VCAGIIGRCGPLCKPTGAPPLAPRGHGHILRRLAVVPDDAALLLCGYHQGRHCV